MVGIPICFICLLVLFHAAVALGLPCPVLLHVISLDHICGELICSEEQAEMNLVVSAGGRICSFFSGTFLPLSESNIGWMFCTEPSKRFCKCQEHAQWFNHTAVYYFCSVDSEWIKFALASASTITKEGVPATEQAASENDSCTFSY